MSAMRIRNVQSGLRWVWARADCAEMHHPKIELCSYVRAFSWAMSMHAKRIYQKIRIDFSFLHRTLWIGYSHNHTCHCEVQRPIYAYVTWLRMSIHSFTHSLTFAKCEPAKCHNNNNNYSHSVRCDVMLPSSLSLHLFILAFCFVLV